MIKAGEAAIELEITQRLRAQGAQANRFPAARQRDQGTRPQEPPPDCIMKWETIKQLCLCQKRNHPLPTKFLLHSKPKSLCWGGNARLDIYPSASSSCHLPSRRPQEGPPKQGLHVLRFQEIPYSDNLYSFLSTSLATQAHLAESLNLAVAGNVSTIQKGPS